MKLILGLIWTLILHYQVRSTGKGFSIKKAMLMRISAELPEYSIQNFTTDWNDGRALCGLVNSIKRGTCPNHRDLDSSKGVENCRLGMDLAKEHMNIPKLILPEDLNDPSIDELSVMTYLSYFMPFSNEELLNWLRKVLPQRNIQNLTTDWISGVNFGALLDKLFEICPDWDKMDPKDKLENMKKMLALIDTHLHLKCPISAKDMTSPDIDEMSMAAFLSQIRVGRLKTGAGNFEMSILKNVIQIREPITVIVMLSEAMTEVQLELFKVYLSVAGKEIAAKLKKNDALEKVYEVTPTTVGTAYVFGQFRKIDVKGSPAAVTVGGLANEKIFIEDLPEGGVTHLNEAFTFTIVSTVPVDPKKLALLGESRGTTYKYQEELVAVDGSNKFRARMVPTENGRLSINVTFDEEHINGSPFALEVVDSNISRVDCDIPEVLHIGTPIELPINLGMASENPAAFKAWSEDPHLVEASAEKTSSDSYKVTLTPKEVGCTVIHFTFGGKPIPNTPFSVHILDCSRCIIEDLDFLDEGINAGEAVVFQMDMRLAGGRGLLKPEVFLFDEHGNRTSARVSEYEDSKFKAETEELYEEGIYRIEIKYGGQIIKKKSFNVNREKIDDRCHVTGPGIKSAVARVPSKFKVMTMLHKAVEQKQLVVTVKSVAAGHVATVDIEDNGDTTYTVTYTCPKAGSYLINVLLGKEPVPGSPFKVPVIEGALASLCRAYGPALEPKAALMSGTPLEFFVDASQAGKGNLIVVIRGRKDDPKVFITDMGRGEYSIKFEVLGWGKYYANVWWGNNHILGSPFPLTIHKAPNPGLVKAYGPGIEPRLDINIPAEITIDTREAGFGTLGIRVHGIKDTFHVHWTQSSENPRIRIATYDPRGAGTYTISIKWEGSHIPGSPYTVEVFDPDSDQSYTSTSASSLSEDEEEEEYQGRKVKVKDARVVKKRGSLQTKQMTPAWTSTPVTTKLEPVNYKLETTPLVKAQTMPERYQQKLEIQKQQLRKEVSWTNRY